MNESPDVIIIGGGAAGLAAACELNRKRAKFLLVEARQRL
jgi:cation diffusion facilitator CzcD-associated flavoprotein CzcO